MSAQNSSDRVKPRIRLMRAVLLASAIAVGVSGCAANETTSSVTDPPELIQGRDHTLVTENQNVPAEVLRLRKLTPEQFIQEPPSDQRAYAYFALDANAAAYTDYYPDSPPFVESSPSNTDQEVLDNLLRASRTSELPLKGPEPGETTSVYFNSTEAIKLLSGWAANPDPNANESRTRKLWPKYRQLSDTQQVPIASTELYTAKHPATVEDLRPNKASEKLAILGSREIVADTEDYATYNVCLGEFTSFDGNAMTMWLLC